MALSDDLIAQFAKITKDKQERVKEATVYGKIVIQNDKKFVMIDGSNTLTPVVSTSEANEGERVTVMIKDHTATITGNISNPSSSSGTVGKLAEEYSDVDSRVADMEDILSGDFDLNDLKDAINNKADKSEVSDISGRMDAVEGEMSDVTKEMDEVSKSMATVAGEVKDKADAKVVEGLNTKMEEIYPMVQEHERILSEGGGPSNPDEPSTPSGPIHLSDETATVENGFIKNDMIDMIDAGKIKSGVIDTSLVDIADAQGIVKIDGPNIQIINPDTNTILFELGVIKDSFNQLGWVIRTADGTVVGNHANGLYASSIKQGLMTANFEPTNLEEWNAEINAEIKALEGKIPSTEPFNPDADTIYLDYYPEISQTWNYYPTYNEFFRYLDEQFKLMKDALNNYGIWW
jgi:hypothetical protein